MKHLITAIFFFFFGLSLYTFGVLWYVIGLAMVEVLYACAVLVIGGTILTTYSVAMGTACVGAGVALFLWEVW
jgi:hypothetical protein